MADFDTTRKNLEMILDRSHLYFVDHGDSWTTRRDGCEIKYEVAGDGIVRASIPTGVFVTDDNRAAIRAICDHMSGWEFKISEFGVTDEGEVTLYYDREVGGPEDPEGMARRLAHTIKEAGEKLRRVAAGESPHDVARSDRTLSDLLDSLHGDSSGLGGLGGLAGLLGD